jgi:hypothetical protein
MRFQVLTAASMMFRIVFWGVLPCKKIVDRRFRGTCCLQYIPEDNSELQNVKKLEAMPAGLRGIVKAVKA